MAEVFKQKDSLCITKHASIRYKVENDSMFVHAKKIFVTGKVGEWLEVKKECSVL